DLGAWDKPRRNLWASRLGLAIRAAGRPVVLAAHSLGCHAVAWWARMEPAAAALVRGALLVAPPDVDEAPVDARLRGFAGSAGQALPFRATLVASSDDPYLSLAGARVLAQRWGAQFVDIGARGHINAESRLDVWPRGQALLDDLLGEAAGPAYDTSLAGPSAFPQLSVSTPFFVPHKEASIHEG
ncbi:MAG TPA: alpha/beta hydrolase, partial [Novosphingobium sp.]|nr:alpha/beta hydrolase [Novosphingobium sp.]